MNANLITISRVEAAPVKWLWYPYSLIVDGLLFAVFLLAPCFRKNGLRLPTMDERAE